MLGRDRRGLPNIRPRWRRGSIFCMMRAAVTTTDFALVIAAERMTRGDMETVRKYVHAGSV